MRGGLAHALEVEQVQLVELLRIAAAVDRIEVLRKRAGNPQVVRIIGRGAVAAPGVALHVGERRAVLDLGAADAERQLRIVFEGEVAIDLRLIDFRLHVAVAECRAGDQRARRVQAVQPEAQLLLQYREILAEIHHRGAAVEPGHAQRVARPVWAVRAGFGGRAVNVDVQLELIAHRPIHIETERLVLVTRGRIGAGGGQIAGGRIDDFRIGNRTGHRSLGPGAGGRSVVEPHRHLVALLLDLVFRVGVIQRGGDVVQRLVLQGQLAVGALAFDADHAVVEVLRYRIDIVRTRTVDDVFRARRTRLRNGAVGGGIATECAPAIRHANLAVAEVAFLVAAAQRHAKASIGRGIAEKCRKFPASANRPASGRAGSRWTRHAHP